MVALLLCSCPLAALCEQKLRDCPLFLCDFIALILASPLVDQCLINTSVGPAAFWILQASQMLVERRAQRVLGPPTWALWVWGHPALLGAWGQDSAFTGSLLGLTHTWVYFQIYGGTWGSLLKNFFMLVGKWWHSLKQL